MGAMLYFHVTPFTVPADALLAIQADVLETQYDLDTLVQTQLEQAKAALDEIDEEDEYGLRDEFEEQVQFLESLATLPIPATQEIGLPMSKLSTNSTNVEWEIFWTCEALPIRRSYLWLASGPADDCTGHR